MDLYCKQGCVLTQFYYCLLFLKFLCKEFEWCLAQRGASVVWKGNENAE